MNGWKVTSFWSMVLFLLTVGMTGPALGAGICVEDELGEQIHLNVHPGGLLTGYSEFNGIVTGTAFGSYKVLSADEVMIGGDVNNDCSSGLGLLPGKFNARINVKEMTGAANGFLFLCGGTTIIPFTSALFPCGDTPGQPASWGAFFER